MSSTGFENVFKQGIVVIVIKVQIKSVKIAEAGQGRGVEAEGHVLEHEIQSNLLKPGTERRHLQLLSLGIKQPEVLDAVTLSWPLLKTRRGMERVPDLLLDVVVVVLLDDVQHLLSRPEDPEVRVTVEGAVLQPFQAGHPLYDGQAALACDPGPLM